jgi:hypothetical protein
MGVLRFAGGDLSPSNPRGGTLLVKKIKKALKQPAFTTITITKVL